MGVFVCRPGEDNLPAVQPLAGFFFTAKAVIITLDSRVITDIIKIYFLKYLILFAASKLTAFIDQCSLRSIGRPGRMFKIGSGFAIL